MKKYEGKFSVGKCFAIAGILFILTILCSKKAVAQEQNHMVRLAKIKVDPLQLDKYNAAVKEQMTTAVRTEPCVLTYYPLPIKAILRGSQSLKYMLIQPHTSCTLKRLILKSIKTP